MAKGQVARNKITPVKTMITGLLGEVTAEKKRMEVWSMSGNRTSGALGVRSFSAKNQNREQRKGFAKLAKCRPCNRMFQSAGFGIHLSNSSFETPGTSASLRFPFWGRKNENVIAQAGAVDVCDCVVPQLFCFGG
jgi:hypothetical protein